MVLMEDKGHRLTIAIAILPAELLDQCIHALVYLDFILVSDAVLTQEVKLNVVVFHAVHILHLPTKVV